LLEKQRLNQILEDLVGSNVEIQYVSTAGQENEVIGRLTQVDADVIEVKDILGATIWINRHASTLTALKLLSRKCKHKLPLKKKA